jgi:trimeric autotransporter adhesin
MRIFNKILLTLLTLFTLNQTYTQCNIQASICEPGVAGPFNFTPTGGAYAGGSFANAGCATGAGGNHAYGFITLYITQSGPLNLLINGNSTSGYIDVAIFNIPPGQNPCTAIQNGNNAIGCNFASQSGGCVQFGNTFPCGSSVPAPNVVAGQQIMIIAQNWSNPGSNNFTLQLGPPPGAQTGPPNTTINPVGPFCTTSPNTQLTAVNGGGTWSGPGVSPTGVFNPNLAGVGTHTITYSLGTPPCNSTSTTTITVTSPPTLNLTSNNVTCFGECNGTIDAGFYPGVTYVWNPTNQTTQTINNLCPGNYTVTVTQNGCQSTGSVVITEPPVVVVGDISHN